MKKGKEFANVTNLTNLTSEIIKEHRLVSDTPLSFAKINEYVSG